MIKLSQVHFSDYELKRMTNAEIKENKINRIIGMSNFDDEFFFEKDLHKDIPLEEIRSLMKEVDEEHNNKYSSIYYVAVRENYELYHFEP
jgi:hypothetical protein